MIADCGGTPARASGADHREACPRGTDANMSDTPAQPASRWNSTAPAALAAAAGSICVGTVPTLAMGLYASGLNSHSLLLWRYALALLVLLPLALATSHGLRLEWRQGGRILFLNGFVLGAAQALCYFKAIERIPSSVAITVFFSYPMFAVLIDRVYYGHRPGRSTLVALALIVSGVALTGWPALNGNSIDLVGLAYAAAVPVIYSAYLAISFRYTSLTSPFAAATCIYAGIGTTMLVIGLTVGLILPASTIDWARVTGIALVGGVVQMAAFAYSLPRLRASGYAIIVSLELVTVVVMGVLVLGEQLSPQQALGAVLVMLGVISERLLRGRAAEAAADIATPGVTTDAPASPTTVTPEDARTSPAVTAPA